MEDDRGYSTQLSTSEFMSVVGGVPTIRERIEDDFMRIRYGNGLVLLYG